MPSILLNIQTDRTLDTNRIRQTGQPVKGIRELVRILLGIMSGAITGSVSVQNSTSALAAASGSVALTYANLDDGDTVTIGGVVITAKASGANGTSQFNIQTNATTSGANLAACINANTTLSKHVVASNASGTVTITALQKGSLANLIVMSTSDATAYTLTQLSGGTGGAENAAVIHS